MPDEDGTTTPDSTDTPPVQNDDTNADPKVRLTSGKEYYLSDFYVKDGTPKADEVKRRAKPRSMEEGDPLVRQFFWGGHEAFECRYVVEFQGPDEGPTWKMACCKTYFTLEQLAEHWKLEHNGEVLPEFQS